MKQVILFFIILTLSSLAFAKKVNMNDFNEAMQENISDFVENNPEKYEPAMQKRPSRAPASVETIGEHGESEKKQNEDTYEKIDTFDNQGIGLPKW